MIKACVRVGGLVVEYEGPESLLESKMPAFIGQLAKLAGQIPPPEKEPPAGGDSSGKPEDPGSLASFLQGRGTNQVRRFLATAQWLHLKGKSQLQTADVVKALSGGRQSKLTNPSDCLSKNISKGHCERIPSGGFFVTEEGRASLG